MLVRVLLRGLDAFAVRSLLDFGAGAMTTQPVSLKVPARRRFCLQACVRGTIALDDGTCSIG